jgi:Protein of unknown function (DUF3617)
MIRLKPMVLFTLACLTLYVPTALQAQVRMRAGMWENSVTANGKTATRSACFTAAQAEEANGPVSVMRANAGKALAKSGTCKLKEFKIEGNIKTESFICGATTYSNNSIFHGGDSFETTVTTNEGGVEHVSLMKGHRTGACP